VGVVLRAMTIEPPAQTPSTRAALDPREFIQANLRVAPVPGLPEIRIYSAHPGSGLWRIADPDEEDSEPPYWAYHWAGGTVLARYVLDHPEAVGGKRVLDLGAGSGIVGIAAAKAGARAVIAAETNPFGVAALALNAIENGVSLTIAGGDVTGGPPPAVDLIAAGDVFYAPEVAARVLPFLDRCLTAGIEVLVGDPERAYLPLGRLRRIADYRVADFGETTEKTPSAVFALEPQEDQAAPQ
jgi:predicted nicotinamide N-methyase